MPLVKVQMGSKKWHDLRLKGIGASEVSALFPMERPGYAMSQYTLRKVKRGEIDANSVFSGDPKFAARGLIREPSIAEIIAVEHGLKIKKGHYVIDDHEPLMRASLDYIIEEPTAEIRRQLGKKVDGPGVLQIKSVIPFQFLRHWTKTSAPDYVRIQVAQECAATGYEWGMIGCANGETEYYAYPLRAPQDNGDRLREEIAKFWRDSVLGDVEPPVDHTESTRLCLRAEYPPKIYQPGMANYEADEEADELALAFDTASVNRRQAQQDYDLARNRLVKHMDKNLHAYTRHWFIDQSVSEKQRRVNVKLRNSTSLEGHDEG